MVCFEPVAEVANMFLEVLLAVTIVFGVLAATYEMWTMKRWWPKETGFILAAGIAGLLACVVSGAI